MASQGYRFGVRWFDGIWKELSEQGRCDALGGMEYQRVVRTWLDCGQPGYHYGRVNREQAAAFIVREANRGSNGD